VPLELVVRDNGVGFSADPEKLVQLFSSTKAKVFSATQHFAVPEAAVAAAPFASTSGKFGVGLTASILHSSIIFGYCNFYGSRGVCQITTRTSGALAECDGVVRRCTFGVDQAAGQVICVRRQTASSARALPGQRAEQAAGQDANGEASWASGFVGSEVRIVVPGGDAVGSASGKLKAYFQRLHLSAHLLRCAVT
jgi:hypothetical protein